MNQAFIDNTLLVSAGILALLMNRFTKERKTASVPSFFLLFAPLIIFLNMWAHTVAVSLVNLKRFEAGNFEYNFSFYALLLFGILFIVVSGYNIHCARKRIKGDASQKRRIHWLNITTAILFLPVIFINPIASLPVMSSIVSSIALWSMKRPVNILIYDRKNKSGTVKQGPATLEQTLVSSIYVD